MSEEMDQELVIDAEISYHITVRARNRKEAERLARKWIKYNLTVYIYGKYKIQIDEGTAYRLYTVEDSPKPVEDEDGMYGFTFRTDCL